MGVLSKLHAAVRGIKKFVSISNRRNIPELQEKYDAQMEKVIRVVMTDYRKAVVFKVTGGKLTYNYKDADTIEWDIEARMETDTLLNLLSGRIKVRNHKTGKLEYEPYRYYDAVRWGDIVADGDMANNDNQLAMRVFDENLTEMQSELFPEIQKDLKESGWK